MKIVCKGKMQTINALYEVEFQGKSVGLTLGSNSVSIITSYPLEVSGDTKELVRDGLRQHILNMPFVRLANDGTPPDVVDRLKKILAEHEPVVHLNQTVYENSYCRVTATLQEESSNVRDAGFEVETEKLINAWWAISTLMPEQPEPITELLDATSYMVDMPKNDYAQFLSWYQAQDSESRLSFTNAMYDTIRRLHILGLEAPKYYGKPTMELDLDLLLSIARSGVMPENVPEQHRRHVEAVYNIARLVRPAKLGMSGAYDEEPRNPGLLKMDFGTWDWDTIFKGISALTDPLNKNRTNDFFATKHKDEPKESLCASDALVMAPTDPSNFSEVNKLFNEIEARINNTHKATGWPECLVSWDFGIMEPGMDIDAILKARGPKEEVDLLKASVAGAASVVDWSRMVVSPCSPEAEDLNLHFRELDLSNYGEQPKRRKCLKCRAQAMIDKLDAVLPEPKAPEHKLEPDAEFKKMIYAGINETIRNVRFGGDVKKPSSKIDKIREMIRRGPKPPAAKPDSWVEIQKMLKNYRQRHGEKNCLVIEIGEEYDPEEIAALIEDVVNSAFKK